MRNNLGKDVLKRWVKDYDLPINIYSEPYFSYLVDLYDDYLGTKSKFKLLEEAVSKFEEEDKFLSYYYDVRDEIINSIKNKSEYEDFNTADLSKFEVLSNYPKNNIYKNDYLNKYFISIDLVKANYQSLKYINPKIVSNTNTYDEFISLFTDLSYMSKSKYLRQNIFGNMNPKRQAKVERYLIEKIIDFVKNELLDINDIKMASTDEVVFELSLEKADELSNKSKDITKKIEDELNIQVDIEIFKLSSINDFYVKEFINKEGYELKGGSKIYFPQVYKKYNNLKLDEKDLTFFYEGNLAKFIEPIK